MRLLALIVLILPATSIRATDVLKLPQYTEAEVNVKIDGRLDESVWDQVPVYDDFTVTSPDRGDEPRWRTRTRIFYTKRGLYIGSWNEQPPETLLSRLTSRDDFTSRDGFQVVLDTSGEGRYGYWFQVGLGNSLLDGVILPERHFQRDWDGPWHGASAETDEGWSVEMLLPWAMLNMPRSEKETRRMGIYINRRLGKLNEGWSKPYLPRTEPRFISAFQPIELKDIRPKADYSLYPFVSWTRDAIRQTENFKTGMDIFWRPSSWFRLSAAITPDFGQVEADDVVVNLSAFETFFPEKRLFFLENQDVFTTNSRNPRDGTLLNTRRIGASVASRRGRPDFVGGATFDRFERNQPVELLGAAKATGQVGAMRYGVLTAFEDDTTLDLIRSDVSRLEVPGRDFGVMRLTWEDTQGSGRRAIGWMGTVTEHPTRRAITHGLDGHWQSTRGKATWDGQLFYSDIEGVDGVGMFQDVELTPRKGHTHRFEMEYFDEDIDLNDLGFLRRNDRYAFNYRYAINENRVKGLRSRNTFYVVRTSFNTDDRFTGGGLFFRKRWSFLDNSRIFLAMDYRPAEWDDINSLGNGSFKRDDRWGTRVEWNTDFAEPLVYELGADLREEREGGLSRQYSGRVIYRPNDRFTLQLRTTYKDRDAWLVHQRGREFVSFESEEWRPQLSMDTFLNADQQFRLALQWVGIKAVESNLWQVPVGDGPLDDVRREPEQPPRELTISDLTLQARYRWEIAPLSTLFMVYNRGGRLPGALARKQSSFGNLFREAFSDPQSESFVIKLRYRFGPA